MKDNAVIRMQLNELLKKYGIVVEIKEKSLFMKILAKILFFVPSFMGSFTTTIGHKIYMPKSTFDDDWSYCRILPHEIVHAMDFREKGFLLFSLQYLFPQWLSVFSVLSVLAVINPIHLLWFLFLVALFPFPAKGRTALEMRGYAMSMAVQYWMMVDEARKQSDDFFYLSKIENFTGWNYYKMWPFREDVIRQFQNWMEKIRSNQLDEEFVLVREMQEIFMVESF